MTIIKRYDEKGAIDEAAQIIKDGGLVAFPTETVYGLGANALSAEACKKIFIAKGRPQDNPLIAHVSDYEMLKSIVKEIPKGAKELTDKFWPGPLTIVFEKNEKIADAVTAGLNTVAVRMPSDPVALKIISKSGVPIAAPSANRSKRPSPTKAEHVIHDLEGRIDMIVVGNDCKVGLESTVIALKDGQATILRPGAVTKEDLESVLSKVEVDKAVLHKYSGGKVASPGMKHTHYAPNAEVYLVEYEKDTEKMAKKILKHLHACESEGKKCRALISKEAAEYMSGTKDIYILGSREHENEMAHNYYSALLKTENEADVILVEGMPEDGIGLAYMNRALRSASFKILR